MVKLHEYFLKVINSKKYLYLVLVFVVLDILLLVYYFNLPKKSIIKEIDNSLISSDIENIVPNIKVDIKGEVKNPGLYELSEGSTINDLVKLSGGFTKKADSNNMALSMVLKDEMVVNVPSINSVSESPKKSNNTNKNENNDSNATTNISSTKEVIDTKKSDYEISSNKDDLETSNKENNSLVIIENQIDYEEKIININTAGVDDFITLKGIGLKKAQAIIDYRNTNGLFTDIIEIKNVKGIGDTIYEQIKEFITI